jgi:hypothetical protein
MTQVQQSVKGIRISNLHGYPNKLDLGSTHTMDSYPRLTSARVVVVLLYCNHIDEMYEYISALASVTIPAAFFWRTA